MGPALEGRDHPTQRTELALAAAPEARPRRPEPLRNLSVQRLRAAPPCRALSGRERACAGAGGARDPPPSSSIEDALDPREKPSRPESDHDPLPLLRSKRALPGSSRCPSY